MIIKRPVSTEKSIRVIDTENKLSFVVSREATKTSVKKELEQLFKAKVARVNMLTKPNGEKRAIVKFKQETPAIDVATKLGLM